MKNFLVKWFIFFGIIFGVFLYYKIRINDRISGDLGILGNIPFTTEYDLRIRTYDYTCSNPICKIVDVDSASNCPLLFFGDSFGVPQNGLCNGIASVLDDTVYTVCCMKVDDPRKFIPTRALLYGLENHRFRAGQTIVLESVGRYLGWRFGELDFTKPDRPEGMCFAYEWKAKQSKYILEKQEELKNNEPVIKAGLPAMLTWVRTNMGYDSRSVVFHEKLGHKMFKHEDYADDLFFYIEDLVVADLPDEALGKIAASMNRLFALAEREGVRLYIMIAPDKLDLYYPYIVNPRYPRPNVLECLKRVLPEYANRIINTRDSLAPYLVRGEQDIMRCNDSHWSVYAAEEMGKRLGRRLLRDGLSKTKFTE